MKNANSLLFLENYSWKAILEANKVVDDLKGKYSLKISLFWLKYHKISFFGDDTLR